MATLILLLCILQGGLCQSNILGKFVFHDAKSDHRGDQLAILHSPDSVRFAPQPGDIPSDEVASILSHSLGVSTYKELKWNGLYAGSLFKQPKAAVLFTIDGLPADEKLKVHAAVKFPVKLSEVGSTAIGMLTINGRQTLSSHITSVFDGKSRTVSVSASEMLATAGYGNGQHSKTVFWSEIAESWKVLDGSGESFEALTRKNILAKLDSVLPSAGFSVDEDRMKIKVNTKSLQFTFDMARKEDFTLLSELVMIQAMVEELRANSNAVNDEAPDVYLFSISSLQAIESRYGAESEQMQGAILLLEKFIADITKEMVKLYGGDVIVAALTLQSPVRFLREHKSAIASVFSSFEKEIQKSESLSPDIHIPGHLEDSARQKLCKSIQGSISSLSDTMKFMCVDPVEVRLLKRRSLLATLTAEAPGEEMSGASVYDPVFPVIWNIWLWLIVVLAIAVYVISLSLWYMDPGRDSIIYRLTQQRIKSD